MLNENLELEETLHWIDWLNTPISIHKSCAYRKEEWYKELKGLNVFVVWSMHFYGKTKFNVENNNKT